MFKLLVGKRMMNNQAERKQGLMLHKLEPYLSKFFFVLKTRTTPDIVSTFVSHHCFCAVFLE
jgi:hypothetical protein